MALPWTRPSPATQADSDLDVLYASVGCALTRWELIESELSHWYALFIGKMWKHEAYDEYYENGKTGQGRINLVEKAGAKYFVTHPDQEIEAKFSLLIRATRKLSDRRHEIAHGMSKPVQWFWPVVKDFMKPPVGEDYEYILVPPHYQRNWFDPVNWNPEFVYSSKEIYEIENAFLDQLRLLGDFRHEHLPKPPERT